MLRRVNLWLVHALVLGTLQGCGGCGEDSSPPVSARRDGGGDGDGDGDSMLDAGPPPIELPDADAIYPGDPPEELEGQSCAADTNKVYALGMREGTAPPAQLAVDVLSSRFGMAFIGTDEDGCTGVSFAELYGAPGVVEPSAMTAYNDCTLVELAAIARGDGLWLMAVVDNRMDARDLWIHAFDPMSRETVATHRVTENMAAESAVQLLNIDREHALLAWTETAFDGTGTTLNVQFLSGEGEPTGDVMVLEEASPAFYASLQLVELGEHYIGLAYRRDDGEGGHAIVLDVLDNETLERDRDPWVLTTDAGEGGTVDIGSDQNGAGIAYSIWQGPSRQLWFQALGLDGRAAPVQNAGNIGGPSEPSRIVGIPQLAIDISLAKRPTGFAVAYRALPSVGVPVAQIRAHFLDRFGRIVGESAVALASEHGGQTAFESAYDGTVVLSWTDTDEDGNSTLRSLVLPCGS